MVVKARIGKRIWSMLCCLLLLSSLVACEKSGAETQEVQGNTEDKIEIGVCFDSFVIERWQRDREVFVSAAKELGAEVNVQSANGVIEEQKKQIDYFIQKEVDVIVIVCIDSDGLAESVNRARDAGIKVIAYDRLIRNADVDLYISFDNAMVGTLMANAINDAGISNGKIIMIGGDLADYNVSQVENAFQQGMAKNRNHIIDTVHAQGWKAETASDYVYEHFDRIEEADAIMCGNDSLASQAIRALAERRKAGKICVVGQDAELEACQHIVEGTQNMTVYKPVEKLAKLAAECAVHLAKGESITEAEVSSFHDGSYSVPYVKLDPIMVTKDNIDEVIVNGGFHLKEDIYLNIPEKMPQ